jgi:hypothetical protein
MENWIERRGEMQYYFINSKMRKIQNLDKRYHIKNVSIFYKLYISLLLQNGFVAIVV